MTLVPKSLSSKLWGQHKYYWDKENPLKLETQKTGLSAQMISAISQQLYRLSLTMVQFMPVFSLQKPFMLQKSWDL